jgi:hypothetical protein
MPDARSPRRLNFFFFLQQRLSVCMLGCCENCVGVLVVCVLVFTVFYMYIVCTVFCIVPFMYIYSYLFCLYWCKDYCHRVTTQLQLVSK